MSQFVKTKILVVDDDEHICELIRLYFEEEGFAVNIANDGNKAIESFKSATPDVVILDIMLPGADGWQVCREIRKISQVPIIMLSAKGETFDKVLGLELGADDYMVKPFETKELIARVKAILRRTKVAEAENHEEVVFPNLVVNKTTYTVKLNGEEVQMPPKELELLFFLSSNPNKVYTRDQLLEYIWGYDFFGDSRTVDVHIKRLREKVEDPKHNWQIKTVWGIGYKFEVKQ